MQNEQKRFESLCIHDQNKEYTTLPHQLPIYATSSFEFSSIDEGIDIFSGNKEGHVYSRYGNPTIDTVAAKIASLESFGTDTDSFALLTSSGMSAISTLSIALFEPGDALLTQENLYGGTTELFEKILKRYGVEVYYADLGNKSELESKIKKYKNIKGIYIESPTNPTLACVDLEIIAKIAIENKVHTIIDNTFPTPYLQRPFSFGIDFIIHSTTKYLNGHGNSISGIIIARSSEHKNEIWKAQKLLGTNCNAFDAWLLNNGLKTLQLRMDRHCQNAMALAKFLNAHNKITTVHYLGLQDNPYHELAKRQMSDFGGMLSFEIDGNLEDARNFMNKIKFCTLAPTLGDVDTLVVHPASMSHLNIPKEIRERNGISDTLVRISVGIENINDIIEDITQALR